MKKSSDENLSILATVVAFVLALVVLLINIIWWLFWVAATIYVIGLLIYAFGGHTFLPASFIWF